MNRLNLDNHLCRASSTSTLLCADKLHLEVSTETLIAFGTSTFSFCPRTTFRATLLLVLHPVPD